MISDRIYMGVAHDFAQASTSHRTKVGCILVQDRNIIAFGYNGTPSGFDNDCEDQEGNTKREVLHAESNAIAKCAQSTQTSKDAIMYVTSSPCLECAKLIIQAGISKVFYLEEYRLVEGLHLLSRAGVEIEKLTL